MSFQIRKKILILSYFFPPSNFAGSYRVASFAKYLHKYGYYPIVVTRQAPENAGNFREMAKDCGKDTIHQKHEGYEVYYLPYKGNLRDRIYAKYGDEKFVFARKILSFFELIFQGITVRAIPYNNIYFFAKSYLKKNTDIELLLCSGKPYQLFSFAHLLNKKLGVKWVADYRDEWNSWMRFNHLNISLKQKFLYRFESMLEKKWTKSAALITTVTEHWAKNLNTFLKKPAHIVLNGYDFDVQISIDENSEKDERHADLTIVHTGSLYSYQPVELFVSIVCKHIRKGYNIQCYFVGVTNEPENEWRIRNTAKELSEYFIITDRIPQKELLSLMTKADAFLMVGYQELHGWMSSKILEYLPWHKPILLCPSGNEELEQLLNKHSKTFISNSEEALEEDISFIYNNKSRLKVFNQDDETYSQFFSREKQVSVLAKHLEKVGTSNYENIKVLCFHRVSDEKSPAYPPMPVKVFERLINFLKNKYEIVGFDNIHEETIKPKLIITFDDGYEDFYTNVFPILKKHNVKTVLSIIPSLVESGKCPWSQILNKCIESAFYNKNEFEITSLQIKVSKLTSSNIEKKAVKVFHELSKLETNKVEEIIDRLSAIYNPELTPMVSWAQIKELHSSGLVEIASHSMTHCILTQIENKEALHEEILNSKTIIEDELSTKIKIFTPPGSFYNKTIEGLIFSHDYDYLMNVDNCIWNTSKNVVSRILMPYNNFYKNKWMVKQYIPKIKSLLRIFLH